MDLANNNEASSHFDDITERNEEIQRNVDAMVEGMWQDKETICRIIEENFDIITVHYHNSYDVKKAIKETITYYMTIEAERELGL